MYTTMSISSFGPSTLSEEKRSFAREKNPVDYSDVEGSKTTDRYGRYLNRPNLFDTSDVKGSNSMTLHKARNGPCDNTLRVNDIDGARAKIRDKFLHTKRHIDPMCPEYDLPKYSPPPPYEPKFVKDPLNSSDIEGAKSKSLTKYDVRPINKTDDIDGAQTSWRPRHARVRLESAPKDIMEVTDISKRTHRFVDHTSRDTDPVDPVYVVNGMELRQDTRYTKPRKNPQYVSENHLLMTSDIEGAQPGWVPPAMVNPPLEKRREFRNTNFIGDIDGAKADTIKHSIWTKRTTNPLSPQYQGLDPGIFLRGPVDPSIPAEIYSKPTVFTQKPTTTSRVRTESVSDSMIMPGGRKGSNKSANNSTQGLTDVSPGFVPRPFSEPTGTSGTPYAAKFDTARDLISPSNGNETMFPDTGYLSKVYDTAEFVAPSSKPPLGKSLHLDLGKATKSGSGGQHSRSSSHQFSPMLSAKSTGSGGSSRAKLSPMERARQEEINSVRSLR